MFKKIFLFELGSWFDKPAFYIYAVIVVAFSAFMMASSAGAFDSNTATVTSLKYINSPNSLLGIIMGIGVLVILLFPVVVGASIHKDYKYDVHKVMFSYPFGKPAYFFGKYLSALVICFILLLLVAVGVGVGMSMPGVNPDLVGPHSITPYLRIYGIYILPGVFLFSAIIFGVVTFSRSVVAGFVTMIALYILQGVVETAFVNNDLYEWAAILDPFGPTASNYYTKYWTIAEENNSPIPFKGYILWNRLLWLAIGAAILFWSYRSFEFHVQPKSWSWPWSKKEELKSAEHKTSKSLSIALPTVKRGYGFLQIFQSAWQLTKIDLGYILRGGPFIVISILGLLMLFLIVAFSGQIFGTKTLPTTANMLLVPISVFRLFITLLTMVYAGMIINRRTSDNIYQLEDVTATNNISFLLSKFMSITLMQAVLLFIPLIAGVGYQVSQGYFNFEFGLYLYDLYVVRWIQFVPWTLLALFVYTLIPNYYIGLVTILVLGMGMGFIDRLGVEQAMFQFNAGPNTIYSDISGYGAALYEYLYYRMYWVLGGLVFFTMGWMLWRRGVSRSIVQRLSANKQQWGVPVLGTFALSLIAFIAAGFYLYQKTNVQEEYISSKEREEQTSQYEILYKKYESTNQPRIVDINLDVDLYPKQGDLKAKGYYWLKNKTNTLIDTIILDHGDMLQGVSFSASTNLVLHDSIFNFRVYELGEPLNPGDSIQMDFEMANKANTLFNQYAPVRANGTFMNSSIFPNLGYQSSGELSDNKTRKKYDLPEKERMPDQTDSVARGNTYITNSADWVNFEITIGTEADQIAMAPGNLVKDWVEGDRKYYQYKMKRPMLNFYNISSARYEVLEDKWNDVNLAIYYHKGHEYNLDRMMQGLKDGLDYYTDQFSPYQHDQVRILEFPRGGFAQSFANTIPFAEDIGFIAQNDDSDEGGVDFTYIITAHELAHQWWAHQVIGANAKGATMLSESLSEYSALKVLEKRYGSDKMRKFLKDALDKYLLQRSVESSKELPLAYNENQAYIHYRKGSVVFYALSDLIGEEKLNGVLSAYIDSVAFQEPPYTVAMDLVNMLKEETPDSLDYFIEDMFENITLYDNRIEETGYIKNDNGTYTVDITAHVVKYRTDERGKQNFLNAAGDSLSLVVEGKRRPTLSYPLSDYIDVGVFGTEEVDGKGKETVLYLQKHKISQIENKFTITVDQEPKEVGIDPYNKLIDRNSDDNRRKVTETE